MTLGALEMENKPITYLFKKIQIYQTAVAIDQNKSKMRCN